MAYVSTSLDTLAGYGRDGLDAITTTIAGSSTPPTRRPSSRESRTPGTRSSRAGTASLVPPVRRGLLQDFLAQLPAGWA